MIKRFEDLMVWQKARTICKKIFDLYQQPPFSKDFPLVNQINGSSGSVMDNIAEGFGRQGNKEFVQFLTIAKGSCLEVKSQLYRAWDRGYLSDEQANALLEEVQSLDNQIGGFIHYLQHSGIKGQKFKEPDAPYYGLPDEE